MPKENNKMQVDIDTLKKQNVNDLLSIKELYSKLKEVEEKITQIKYIDNTLVKKLKKEYEKLKKDYESLKCVILDENIQFKLTNDIKTINSQLDHIENKQYVTPEEFGANVNNSDNTEQLNNMFLFAKNKNVSVKLPPDKKFSFTSIVETNGVNIEGYNITSVLEGSLYLGSGQTIKNMTLKGSLVANKSIYKNVKLINCNFIGKTTTFLNVNDRVLEGLLIDNCEISGYTYGIDLVNKGTESAHVTDINIKNSYFHDNKNMNVQIINRYSVSNPTHGIKNIIIEDNIFIGVANASKDSQINVSLDDDPTKLLSDNIEVRNNVFKDGYFSFENAGMINLKLYNNKIGKLALSNINGAEVKNNIINSNSYCYGDNVIFENNIVNATYDFNICDNLKITRNDFEKLNLNNCSGIIEGNYIFSSDTATKVNISSTPQSKSLTFTNNTINYNEGAYDEVSISGNNIGKVICNNNFDKFKRKVNLRGCSHSRIINKNSFYIYGYSTNSQTPAIITVKYASRKNNTPVGGMFNLILGTYNQVASIPIIQNIVGTITPTVVYDSTEKRFTVTIGVSGTDFNGEFFGEVSIITTTNTSRTYTIDEKII